MVQSDFMKREDSHAEKVVMEMNIERKRQREKPKKRS